VTAAAIASDLGIEGEAITGTDFAALSDDVVQSRIDGIGVIARVTPEQKVRLVDVLRARDQVVAMTGDGVNDAPALKKADIGVAMGITGTDVAKEAAVMILTDDNFATIVRAVELGRGLYDSLMKYIRFQMGCLFGFISLFLGAGVFNVLSGAPFLPVQSLYVNFTTDVFQSVGLGLGKETPGVMERPPRAKESKVLPLRLAVRLVCYGALMGGATLLVIHLVAQSRDDTTARTMGLVTFSMFNLLFALTTNDEFRSVFSRDLLENTTLIKTTAFSVLATYLVTGPDFMNRLFQTVSLDTSQWLICVATALSIIVVSEVEKLIRRHTVRVAGAVAA
jgi:Ca2+-transporting ATPase